MQGVRGRSAAALVVVVGSVAVGCVVPQPPPVDPVTLVTVQPCTPGESSATLTNNSQWPVRIDYVEPYGVSIDHELVPPGGQAVLTDLDRAHLSPLVWFTFVGGPTTIEPTATVNPSVVQGFAPATVSTAKPEVYSGIAHGAKFCAIGSAIAG